MSDGNDLKHDDAGAPGLQPGQVLNVTVTGIPATSETISLVVPCAGGKTRRLAERFDSGPWTCVEPGTEASAGSDATSGLPAHTELLRVTLTDGMRTFRAVANVPARRHFETGEIIACDQNQTVEVTPAIMDGLLGVAELKPFGFSISGRVGRD